ncbi:hypothetical protein HanXRQr2_Chr08g0327131 [Helianthus annuus]|uniref:Uncharacterized protein n=1 Tax=Helianthus annuus TaxID=4232 RepID=A0A9K3ICU6_HELAN|nr:hypothetical protein HanXRQr2_Chr08g0327131 [Helianthus annuus]
MQVTKNKTKKLPLVGETTPCETIIRKYKLVMYELLLPCGFWHPHPPIINHRCWNRTNHENKPPCQVRLRRDKSNVY